MALTNVTCNFAPL